MERFHTEQNDLILIGDLANLYQISKRTLRLYQERGLLIPAYVDEQTGYRYYSSSQLPRLEAILQMKNAGMSLKQIRQMLETEDLSLFEAILGEQIDVLEEQIKSFQAHRASLLQQLESCRYMRNTPRLDEIFTEYIPRRHAFVYRGFDAYDLGEEYPNGSPWREALARVRSVFQEHNIPMALFQQIGGVIDQKYLLHNRFLCCGAYIPLQEERQYGLPTTVIPSGTYVCMYHRYEAMDNLDECRGARMLMDYIHAKELRVTGFYIAQVVAERALFDNGSSSILVKQQIPVKISIKKG